MWTSLKGARSRGYCCVSSILCFSHYLAPYHKYSYNDMKKTSTKFHQEALPLMVFSYFCRHIIKSTALHGRFLPQRMSPFTKEVRTTFSWTKNLTDENTSMTLTLTMYNSCSLGFWLREAEWQSERAVRVLDVKFRGLEFNPRLTAEWICFYIVPNSIPRRLQWTANWFVFAQLGFLSFLFKLLVFELVFETQCKLLGYQQTCNPAWAWHKQLHTICVIIKMENSQQKTSLHSTKWRIREYGACVKKKSTNRT